MSLTNLIILCIFLALLLWTVLYTPPLLEGLKKPKPKPITAPLPGSPPPKLPKKKTKFNLIKAIRSKIKKINGANLMKLLPRSIQKKVASIIPAAKKELKRMDEKKRKDREAKTRLKLEQESKGRITRAYATIDKMMELATKYPDTKYEIQSILNKGINDFKYGSTIVNSIKSFIENSFPDKTQLIMYIQMLRESMSFSSTYKLAELR
jgi:hypothetical protein